MFYVVCQDVFCATGIIFIIIIIMIICFTNIFSVCTKIEIDNNMTCFSFEKINGK